MPRRPNKDQQNHAQPVRASRAHSLSETSEAREEADSNQRPGKEIRTNRTRGADYRGTSLRLRCDVLERAKTLALRRHMSMAGIVEIALDEYLTAHGLPR